MRKMAYARWLTLAIMVGAPSILALGCGGDDSTTDLSGPGTGVDGGTDGGAGTGGAAGQGGAAGGAAGQGGTAGQGGAAGGAAGQGGAAGTAGAAGQGGAAGTAGAAGQGGAAGGAAGQGGTAGQGGAAGGAAGQGGTAGQGGAAGTAGAAGQGGAAGGAAGQGGTAGTAGTAGAAGTGGAAGQGGSGGSPSCTPEDSKCSTSNGADGLCKNGACASCSDPADDATCATAYNGTYLCLSGECSPGDCRADTDCNGGICGLTKTNFCDKCTTDAQCQAASYGANSICDVNKGICVSNACSSEGQACTANPADVCCNSACIPGECCSNADCASAYNNKHVCTGNQCAVCDPVSSTTFYVDPNNGDDTAGTGSGTSGGSANPACAFKSITRALHFIGTAAAGTKIIVKGPSTVSEATGETFPIVVPTNITISGDGKVVIQVPATKVGFELSSPASGLSKLDLDGQSNQAQGGIEAIKGSSTTTVIDHVKTYSFAHEGIQVFKDGRLTIDPGVESYGNNDGNNRGTGLLVRDKGIAYISVAKSEDPVKFYKNSGAGIVVLPDGAIKIDGEAATDGTGSVQAFSNNGAGVAFKQEGKHPEDSKIVGMLAWDNQNNGMVVYGGSSVTLRKSVLLKNGDNGIFVVRDGDVNATVGTDFSNIDLGTSTEMGHNTFQMGGINAPINQHAGICFMPGGGMGADYKLTAVGNLFSNSDCTQSNPPNVSSDSKCDTTLDIGGVRDTVMTKVKIDVSTCSY